jgi:hypothetical protein
MGIDEKIASFFTAPPRVTEPGTFSSLFLRRREARACLIGNAIH